MQQQIHGHGHPSAIVSLKARDQFASLLMLTHPRCGLGGCGRQQQQQQQQQVGVAIRVVWEYCIEVTRVFCVPVECVAQFRVSDALGSVVGVGVGGAGGRGDDEVLLHWVCGPRSVFKKVLNANHCNVVETTFYEDDFTASFYLRNILVDCEVGNERCCLARDVVMSSRTSLNPKWFVLLVDRSRNLLIAPTTTTSLMERNSPESFRCVVAVPIVTNNGSDMNFFLNHTRHDEGVLLSVKKTRGAGAVGGGGGEQVSTVALTRVDIQQTWSSKALTVLSCTRFQLANDVHCIGDALVMQKRNGSRAFILTVGYEEMWRQRHVIHVGEEDGGGTSTMIVGTGGASAVFVLPHRHRSDDWVVSLSQLSASLFCVGILSLGTTWNSGYHYCPQSLEIWDINQTVATPTGGGSISKPLREIELSNSVRGIFAEGGLLLTCSSPRPRPRLLLLLLLLARGSLPRLFLLLLLLLRHHVLPSAVGLLPVAVLRHIGTTWVLPTRRIVAVTRGAPAPFSRRRPPFRESDWAAITFGVSATLGITFGVSATLGITALPVQIPAPLPICGWIDDSTLVEMRHLGRSVFTRDRLKSIGTRKEHLPVGVGLVDDPDTLQLSRCGVSGKWVCVAHSYCRAMSVWGVLGGKPASLGECRTFRFPGDLMEVTEPLVVMFTHCLPPSASVGYGDELSVLLADFVSYHIMQIDVKASFMTGEMRVVSKVSIRRGAYFEPTGIMCDHHNHNQFIVVEDGLINLATGNRIVIPGAINTRIVDDHHVAAETWDGAQKSFTVYDVSMLNNTTELSAAVVMSHGTVGRRAHGGFHIVKDSTIVDTLTGCVVLKMSGGAFKQGCSLNVYHL
ncbi:hypothetical protein Pelo_2671 [Pelomyxa schiedti]|nr:hypothetical protein Pelo_2671 [Pelomyxa schiedti]